MLAISERDNSRHLLNLLLNWSLLKQIFVRMKYNNESRWMESHTFTSCLIELIRNQISYYFSLKLQLDGTKNIPVAKNTPPPRTESHKCAFVVQLAQIGPTRSRIWCLTSGVGPGCSIRVWSGTKLIQKQLNCLNSQSLPRPVSLPMLVLSLSDALFAPGWSSHWTRRNTSWRWKLSVSRNENQHSMPTLCPSISSLLTLINGSRISLNKKLVGYWHLYIVYTHSVYTQLFMRQSLYATIWSMAFLLRFAFNDSRFSHFESPRLWLWLKSSHRLCLRLPPWTKVKVINHLQS